MTLRMMVAAGAAVAVTASGCAFDGVNSLPLPGAVGRESDASTYHIELANVITLEPNSPVLIDDVVVGSVARMSVDNWHAVVEVSIQPGVVVPANVVASVGQTSLLGSMHVALGAPLGKQPEGHLPSGATIPMDRTMTYPSTEQTLSSLSVVVNGGGLGQIGDIIHNFNGALTGRQEDVRELIGRLDTFITTLDDQRDNLVKTIEALNRLSVTFAGQSDVIKNALRDIPPALDVLIKERPTLTTALEHLRVFSDTATGVVNNVHSDLVANLQHLQPAIKALADVGPELDLALAYAPIFPYTQDFINRGIRGDYLNLFATFDLTIPRLKRTLFLGTRWEDPDAVLVPAPGDPFYQVYTYDPLNAGVAPPPAEDALPAPAGTPVAGAPATGPLPGPAPSETAPMPPGIEPAPVAPPGPEVPAGAVSPAPAEGVPPVPVEGVPPVPVEGVPPVPPSEVG